MGYDPRAAGCACDQCPLNGQRVIPPEGNADAVLALIGETPGMNEVKMGRPFVGASGQKLEALLYHVGLKRHQVFISNVILCRPEVPGLEGRKRYDFPTYLAWVRLENAKRKKAALAEAKHNKRGKDVGLNYEVISSPIDCCSMRLGSELAVLERAALKRGQPNGAVVIPLGGFALEAIAGKKGIMKHRGGILAAQMFPNPDLELDKRDDR